MDATILIITGIIIGIAASFFGLGGGFLMVPLLIFLGYSAQKSVGSSFLAILMISASAVVAHGKLANIDYKTALMLGVGGIVGAQIGAHLLEQVTTVNFKKIFAAALFIIAGYLFFKK